MNDRIGECLHGFCVHPVLSDRSEIDFAAEPVQYLFDDGIARVLYCHRRVIHQIECLLEKEFRGGSDENLISCTDDTPVDMQVMPDLFLELPRSEERRVGNDGKCR